MRFDLRKVIRVAVATRDGWEQDKILCDEKSWPEAKERLDKDKNVTGYQALKGDQLVDERDKKREK